jgi:hypothetical protein
MPRLEGYRFGRLVVNGEEQRRPVIPSGSSPTRGWRDRSSTTQFLTVLSSARGAACHQQKLWDARVVVNGDHHRWWLCIRRDLTATLPRVAGQLRQQVFALDAAIRGWRSASWA